MEIIERPYNISFSLNHIRYVFQLDTATGVPAGSFGQLQVKILFANTTEDPWQELATYLLQPATDGKIFLYIQDLLNSRLNYVLPSFVEGNYSTHAAEQYGIYTIHYRLIQDNDPAPGDFITLEEDFTQYVIKGGIEKQMHSRNNFFKYWEAKNFFLTWQPGNRFIDPNQAGYLTFLNPSYNAPDLDQPYSLCYRITDINNNFEEVQVPIAKGLLVHLYLKLKVSLATSFSLDQVYSLEVGVINTGDPVAYTYKFYFEYRPLYCFYDLTYFNSLGGVDSIRVKGDISESIDRTTTEAFGGINVNEPFTQVREHENFYSGILLQKHYKGDLGYMQVKTKELQYSFIDLLSSPGVYMRNAWRWVPVINLQKSQDLGTRKDSLNKFPVEWQLSEQNEVYTPDLTLALGDLSRLEPPFCANITGLTQSFEFDQDGNTYIAYSFIPVAGVYKYTVNLKQEFGATLATQILNIAPGTTQVNNSFTPDQTPAPGLYAIQVITHCTENNLSSGAAVDFLIAQKVCPYVSAFVLTETAADALTVTATMPTSNDPLVIVNSVGVILYRVDANFGAIPVKNTSLDTNTQSYTFTSLQPGNYYAVLQTQCNIGMSETRQTSTVNISTPQSNATITTVSNNGTPGSTRTEVFAIGTDMRAGDQFMLEVYSHQVTVTAVNGDTASSIATKLAAAINNTTAAQWNSAGSAPAAGTPGFPPTATASGNQITIVLNYANQFAASVIKA